MVKRRRCFSFAVLLAVLAAPAGCVQEPPAKLTTNIERPSPDRTEAANPLPSGRESIYSVVNVGDIPDADALLGDVWRIPRYDDVHLAGGPTWREDPYREKYWRFDFYSLRPTANLLWAYYRTNRPQYRDKLITLLRSYVRYDQQHPVSSPVGMDDPHAMAFRAMVLVNTWVKLKRSGDLPADLDTGLLGAIDRVADKLMRPANYQGQYNHGVTQAVALLLVSANLPKRPHAAEWGRLARNRLAGLLVNTIDRDGVEIEKSPFYHFYVLDFMIQTLNWANVNNVPLPPRFAARVNEMIRYGTQIIWPDGQVPMLGSSVQLRPSRSMPLYRPFLNRFPDFAYALSGGTRGRPPADRAAIFPYTGQVVLRSPIDVLGEYRDNSQLLMDVGSLTSKHAHEEPLAFLYYSRGRVLLADSGLNSYERGTAFDYFHGTSAHNTVIVDGRNQDGGPVTAGRTIAGDGWAYQSGTAEVYRGVTHRRSVLLLERDLVLVVDELTAAAPRRFAQLWHLFPGARPLIDGTTALVYDEFDNAALRVTQATAGIPLRVTDHFGETKPMQGWYSGEYGKIMPNHVLEIGTGATLAVRYFTLIGSGPYAGQRATVRGTGGGGRFAMDVCVGRYFAHVGIDRQGRPGERVTVSRRAGCLDE